MKKTILAILAGLGLVALTATAAPIFEKTDMIWTNVPTYLTNGIPGGVPYTNIIRTGFIPLPANTNTITFVVEGQATSNHCLFGTNVYITFALTDDGIHTWNSPPRSSTGAPYINITAQILTTNVLSTNATMRTYYVTNLPGTTFMGAAGIKPIEVCYSGTNLVDAGWTNKNGIYVGVSNFVIRAYYRR
jgi:hypothetical protein